MEIPAIRDVDSGGEIIVEDMIDKISKEIDARLDKLLAENTWNDLWVGQDEKSRSIIDDGCMDVTSYNNANKKILWMLKEHNGNAPEYGKFTPVGVWDAHRMHIFWDMYTDPERFSRNVNWYRTLKLVELASRGILNNCKMDVFEKVRTFAITTFKQLSFVEMGKTPGGSATSYRRLCRLTEAWGDIVVRQIKYYEPEVIVVAGSQFGLLKNLLKGISDKCRHVGIAQQYLWDGIPIVYACHPGYRGVDRQVWVDSVIAAAMA